jgi:alkylated DNA repair dioxygenase AlkB
LPDWIAAVGHKLAEDGWFSSDPDQVIINEYEPGQGIAPHIDRETCFGPVVASLSLAGDTVMEFSKRGTSERVPVFLPNRSLLIITGEARYRWRHGIAQRRFDTVNSLAMPRRRRVSLTFRTVLTTA